MSLNGDGKKPRTDFRGDKGFTIQSDRDDADINKIVARLEKGAQIRRLDLKEPFYGDVTAFDGLQEAMIKVQNAEMLFMDFEAGIRERFDNDPVKFIEFLENPENKQEAIDLGIIKPQPRIPEPQPAATPAPAAAAPAK